MALSTNKDGTSFRNQVQFLCPMFMKESRFYAGRPFGMKPSKPGGGGVRQCTRRPSMAENSDAESVKTSSQKTQSRNLVESDAEKYTVASHPQVGFIFHEY